MNLIVLEGCQIDLARNYENLKKKMSKTFSGIVKKLVANFFNGISFPWCSPIGFSELTTII